MVDFKKQLKKRKAPRLDLNPSAADRWTTCKASPQFILDNWDRVPVSDDTRFNTEGTTAHEVAAAMLQNRQPDEKDTYKCPVPITPEMRWHAWNYAEYVNALVEPGGRLLVEQKLPLWYMPERNAIVDAAVINPDSIHIVDFKYGEGIIVNPTENLQGIIYAETVLRTFGVQPLSRKLPVTIHIYQPRGRAAHDGAIHFWETTAPQIADFTRHLANTASAIQRGAIATFAPSEKACQWCPAKGFCPARQQHFAKDVKALATIPAGDKHLPPVKAVTVEQLVAILKHKPAIEKWLKDAEAYALEYMSEGNPLPGLKLVLSRPGNRYWSNPKEAAKLLLKTHLRREEVIEEKVISPKGAEDLLGKHGLSAELTKYIQRPPGKPVIAPADDERESCLIDAKAEFDDL
jgi:hypothetical protein